MLIPPCTVRKRIDNPQIYYLREEMRNRILPRREERKGKERGVSGKAEDWKRSEERTGLFDSGS